MQFGTIELVVADHVEDRRPTILPVFECSRNTSGVQVDIPGEYDHIRFDPRWLETIKLVVEIGENVQLHRMPSNFLMMAATSLSVSPVR